MANPKKEDAAEIRRTTSVELLKGMLANPSTITRSVSREAEAAGLSVPKYLADSAVKLADALMARLEEA